MSSSASTPAALAVAAPAATVANAPKVRRRGARPPLTVIVASVVLGVFVLAAIAPGLFTGRDPDAGNAIDALLAPGHGHLFGTDQNGRDVFARIVHGAGPSLLIGVAASGLALVVGTVIGVLAAQGGKLLDTVVTRVLDVFLSIPGLLLAMLLIAALGPSTRNSILAISLTCAPGYARLVRGEVLRIRGSSYVEAATALGWSRPQVVLRHIVPNALGPVLVVATIGVGTAIGIGSGLSFLGLGPQPPTAEWGLMLSSSRDYLAVAWWPAVFPGLAITITVLVVTVVGRHLQLRNEGRVAR